MAAALTAGALVASAAAPAGANNGLSIFGDNVSGWACVALSNAQVAHGLDTVRGIEATPGVSAATDWGDTIVPNFVADAVQYANPTNLTVPNFTALGTHTYLYPGSYQMRTNASNTIAGTDNTVSTATISDTPLSLVSIGGRLTGKEGIRAVAGTIASFQDTACAPSAAAYTVGIDWGDHSGIDLTGVVQNFVQSNPVTFDVAGSHMYREAGTYSITAYVTRVLGAGGSASRFITATTTAVVDEGLLAIGPASPLTGGVLPGTTIHCISTGTTLPPATVASCPVGPTTATGTLATFTDEDPNGHLGDYSSFIDWGDGTFGPGSIVLDTSTSGTPALQFAVSGSHTYASPTPQTYSVFVYVWETDNPGVIVSTVTSATTMPAFSCHGMGLPELAPTCISFT